MLSVGVAGCGGLHAPGASAPSKEAAPRPSTPPVDAAAAFTQYERAAKPFDCSSAYIAMGEAFEKSNYDAVKENGRKQRPVIATWSAELGKIAFPLAVEPIVDQMRENTASELAALTNLAPTDVTDIESIVRLTYEVEVADSSVTVESDDLRAALGHPMPSTTIAADQLDLAHLKYFQIADPLSTEWTAALEANDLSAAKAVNATDEEAAQAYLDRLDNIAWPPGFDDQVTALRESLQDIIDFDRHQVDVATAAQIVKAPESGQAVAQAKSALWDALIKAYHESDPLTACPG
ncbi:hypothetical protein [Mycobacterium sp. OAE908]|uniref:hypothetical protein n=1 Tax=Mycobacterium sp. OAE908 TaxID=2817899 RepID=UPI001AE6EAF8